MSRQFKFRVWDTQLNRFVDSIPLVEEWPEDKLWADSLQYEENPHIYPRNPFPDYNGRFVWMQITGLVDKDRKEIWEWDIVSCSEEQMDWNNTPMIHCGEYRGIVEFSKSGFFIRSLREAPIFWTGVMVIGNVFENKDLLDWQKPTQEEINQKIYEKTGIKIK